MNTIRPALFNIFLYVLLFVNLYGCAGREPVSQVRPAESAPPISRLETLGFTIQAGAFAKDDNAVRFSRHLADKGLDAYYFVEKGLYKVRFGNFPTYRQAYGYADVR